MKNSPLFTICIPSFNAERTIGQTLDSLLNQTYKNFKIKVFDNASTDRTQEIVRAYLSNYTNVELIVHPENIGGEANFTCCIQAGEGDYTAVFHSDDIYSPYMLEESLKVFNKDSRIVATATHANRIDFDEKIIGERFCPSFFSKDEPTLFSYEELLNTVLRFGNFITCPSVIAKTLVYKEQIKNWNGTEFKTSADLDVWLRFARLGKLAFINKPLINYREAIDSYSYNLKKVRTVRHDIFHVLETHLKLSKIDPQTSSCFRFLELKDNALRTYNILRSGSNDKLPQLDPFHSEFIKLAFSDTWHFRYYLISLGIWFYRLLV